MDDPKPLPELSKYGREHCLDARAIFRRAVGDALDKWTATQSKVSKKNRAETGSYLNNWIIYPLTDAYQRGVGADARIADDPASAPVYEARLALDGRVLLACQSCWLDLQNADGDSDSEGERAADLGSLYEFSVEGYVEYTGATLHEAVRRVVEAMRKRVASVGRGEHAWPRFEDKHVQRAYPKDPRAQERKARKSSAGKAEKRVQVQTT